MNVSVAEAKNKLTQLIQAVEKGERVTICRHGKPVVDLIPTESTAQIPPKFGTMKGQKLCLDPNWARPQNDLEAWLQAMSNACFVRYAGRSSFSLTKARGYSAQKHVLSLKIPRISGCSVLSADGQFKRYKGLSVVW